jgi:prepilin-type N-terminal cleavage/methylation domain-containing protein
MKPAIPPHNPRSGFTLVEMLVSVTVLVLIMTFIAQIMNSATISTTLSGQHVDTDSEARLVFDRMNADFAAMSHRTDVDFVFAKQPNYLALATASGTSTNLSGTDAEMFFYSEAPAYPVSASGAAGSPVALIGYTINTTGSSYVPAYSLQRLSKGLSLNATVNQSVGNTDAETDSMVFLTSTAQGMLPFPVTNLLNAESGVIGSYPYPPSDMSDYDLLSPEVLRMDFTFQVKDLTTANSTVYSNYPIGFLPSPQKTTASITNALSIEDAPPPTSYPYTVSGIFPKVGDRYYDTSVNRAYACTNIIPTTTSGGLTQNVPVWTPNGMADVKAIVVSIAILDQRTRRLIPASSTYLDTIASALETPSEYGLNPRAQTLSSTDLPTLTADIWESELTAMLQPSQESSSTSVPSSILGQVRVYQRFFYLNNN